MHIKITSQIGENLAGNFKIIFWDEMSGRLECNVVKTEIRASQVCLAFDGMINLFQENTDNIKKVLQGNEYAGKRNQNVGRM